LTVQTTTGAKNVVERDTLVQDSPKPETIKASIPGSGAKVGATGIGACVGTFVGAFVGDLVGIFVGAFVGVLVGAFVGAFVGDFIGAFVGAFVGGAWAIGVKTQTEFAVLHVSTVVGSLSVQFALFWQFIAL
jgi:uncharacterized protein YqgC (DUF456 family)